MCHFRSPVLLALPLAALPLAAQLSLQVRNHSQGEWQLVATATCPKGTLCRRRDEAKEWGPKQPFQATKGKAIPLLPGTLLELEWEPEDSALNGAVFSLIDPLGRNPLAARLVAPSRQKEDRFFRKPTMQVADHASREARLALGQAVNLGEEIVHIRRDAYGNLEPAAPRSPLGKRKRGEEEPEAAPPAQRPRLAATETKAAAETKAEPAAARVLTIRNDSDRIWQWLIGSLAQRIEVRHCDPEGRLTQESLASLNQEATLLLAPGGTTLSPVGPGPDFCIEFQLKALDAFGHLSKGNRFTWDCQASPELQAGWFGQARREKLTPELLLPGAGGITIRSGEEVIRDWLQVPALPVP
jgi:hypothetical protein